MTNQPRIPEPETIERHVTKMRELCRSWDAHIADLDELNTRLEADIRKSPLVAYRLEKARNILALKGEV